MDKRGHADIGNDRTSLLAPYRSRIEFWLLVFAGSIGLALQVTVIRALFG